MEKQADEVAFGVASDGHGFYNVEQLEKIRQVIFTNRRLLDLNLEIFFQVV